MRVFTYALLVCSLLLATSHNSLAQPNIIHIIADDMGWTDLSSNLTNLGNGSEFYQTPNIDRLAREGLSFTHAYAMPTCVPTRMAIMTGQAGSRTRTYAAGTIDGGDDAPLVPPENITDIPNTTQTLGETLQLAGYNTAHIGKFHITRNEQAITLQHGYDVNVGGFSAGNPGSYVAAEANNQWTYPRNVSAEMDQFAEPYSTAYVEQNILPFANGADPTSLVGAPKHLSDATADAAIDYINGQLGAEQPFYMNLAFHAVHSPIEPRPDLLGKYEGILASNGGQSPDPRHDAPEYAALLEGMDQAVGRLVSYLEDPDGLPGTNDSLLSNTLIVFYGDNGGAVRQTGNGPLQRGKDSLFEGGIRVPMIAYMPGTVAEGTSTSELVQPTDFYPTFAELANATLPNEAAQPLDGVSITSVLDGGTLGRSTVHFHYPGYAIATEPSSVAIAQVGELQYKVGYQYEDRSFQIFELTSDIGEADNLAGTDMNSEVYKTAAQSVVGLREFLDSTDAEYPRVRDGNIVPPPSHLPTVEIQIGGESDATNLGLVVSTESTVDGTQLSFNRDVMLKSLTLQSDSLAGSDSVSLRFLEGDSPFSSLEGYDSGGFQVQDNTMTIAGTIADLSMLRFGTLDQGEIIVSAGTTLLLSGSNATPILNSLAVAEPLSSLATLLLDAELDGELNTADVDRICSAVQLELSANQIVAVELDQNGDNQMTLADVEQWLDATERLTGDADLNGEVGFADFLRLSQNFGEEASWSGGDFDCNGSVDFSDFLALSNRFGQSFPVSRDVSAVPEPATESVLLFWGLVVFAIWLRQPSRVPTTG